MPGKTYPANITPIGDSSQEKPHKKWSRKKRRIWLKYFVPAIVCSKLKSERNPALMQERVCVFEHADAFVDRHIGPRAHDIDEMLRTLGVSSPGELIDSTIPSQIRVKRPLLIPHTTETGQSERGVLNELREIAMQNQIFRSFIGMGYQDCITPPVIQRNILENPGWYTQYTPYQAEISQGRLEALLNFQTMIMDLTAMEIANASLLDEATAAAEAMTMCFSIKGRSQERAFFVSELCHPQTIEIVKTRAEPLGIRVMVGDHNKFKFEQPVFGVLLQYPDTNGTIHDYESFIKGAHVANALSVVAADLLSLTILRPPGEFGADIVVGSAQRFGVSMGYGGPHAAFLATKDAFKRQTPGRIVGVSKDVEGCAAIRLALQTREQHIRRDKATSNICTAQVLLAIMSSMYAVYHGPRGLRRIAEKTHFLTAVLAEGLRRLGYQLGTEAFFDTLRISLKATQMQEMLILAKTRRINLRVNDKDSAVGVALDEVTSKEDIEDLLALFALGKPMSFSVDQLAKAIDPKIANPHKRQSSFLTHSVFNSYHSETEMLRYIYRLQAKDLSLTKSMISLGSCTMKLNATAEMYPVSWPEFASLHPFVPLDQAKGYQVLIQRLEAMLAEITGFSGISLQPNAGSQGEYTGLLVIRKYHQKRGEGHRDVCLIPQSAHGTNPASAALAGMKIVVVRCDESGNIDVADLRAKAEEHGKDLAALMVTYPSTHGVFEEAITEICDIVHCYGGQVYMDGANMNAQVGLCRPAEIGADVCHLNLHKTFAIPHGGGGPGMGPIGVKEHLKQFLPTHPVVKVGGASGIGAVSAAPWGSPSVLPISYAYIAMMGAAGLKRATEVAILNANYIAKRLDAHYPVLYRGKEGRVAHECIVDLRQLKLTSGVEVEDVAKRLMDYGFHAPTVSFPVPGTMMIEPTESESKQELDRFCDAMIAIRDEIAEIENGKMDRQNNVLKNAPHTAGVIAKTEWNRPYSREKAAFPARWVRESKFWPAVARIDQVYGERNLVCACPEVKER
jgi:glycine dehydrogenase